RAVNIALIDEWEKFARRIDVDLFEVLKAIRVRPTHQNIRYPGLGVGGNCLSKDPMFGTTAVQDIFGLAGFDFPLSTAAVAINSRMPAATVALLEEMIPGGLAGKRVLILGASYREDVGDTRHSPSLTLSGMLIGKRATVAFADPLVEGEIGVPLHRELPDAHGFDAVILAVGHKPYRAIDLVAWSGTARPVVLDANGVLSRQQLQSLRDAGFEVAAIGRGLLRVRKLYCSAASRDHIHDIEHIDGDAQIEHAPTAQCVVKLRLSRSPDQDVIENRAQPPRDSRMAEMHDVEAMTFQQQFHGACGKIMQMGRRMDHPPLWAAQPGIDAPDVAGGQREDAPRPQIVFDFFDEEIGALEMLHGVPHGDNVVFSAQVAAEIIALLDIQSELAAAIRYRIL